MKGKETKKQKKVHKVMEEFKEGHLHSGSKKGPVVHNPKQAIAIGLSEARQAGAHIPKRKENKMHKRIMEKSAKALTKDAKHYSKEAKHEHGAKKKHEIVERKEAKQGAKVMKKLAKKAHEY